MALITLVLTLLITIDLETTDVQLGLVFHNSVNIHIFHRQNKRARGSRQNHSHEVSHSFVSLCMGSTPEDLGMDKVSKTYIIANLIKF